MNRVCPSVAPLPEIRHDTFLASTSFIAIRLDELDVAAWTGNGDLAEQAANLLIVVKSVKPEKYT